MIYTIQNEHLTVEINDKGAELWSVKDKEGTEYLWQGNEQYWGEKAPNLFPYIARLTEGKYRLQGKLYEMGIHGFAKKMVFEAEQITGSHIAFSLRNNEETYDSYPYCFAFSVIYRLEDKKIVVTYCVKNEDDKEMYFGIGGHPGFNVPLEAGLTFEDYYLEFNDSKKAKRIEFSPDCFVTERLHEYSMEDGVRIPLAHNMFDDDAIVLTDVATSVLLAAKSGKKGIRVTYPDMDYIGFWHKPKTDAPYVCIEPWSSLPSRKGIIEEFATKSDLIHLNSGCEYENQYIIEVI